MINLELISLIHKLLNVSYKGPPSEYVDLWTNIQDLGYYKDYLYKKRHQQISTDFQLLKYNVTIKYNFYDIGLLLKTVECLFVGDSI